MLHFRLIRLSGAFVNVIEANGETRQHGLCLYLHAQLRSSMRKPDVNPALLFRAVTTRFSIFRPWWFLYFPATLGIYRRYSNATYCKPHASLSGAPGWTISILDLLIRQLLFSSTVNREGGKGKVFDKDGEFLWVLP